MTAVVFEPHQDDAVLFSCFNAIRTRAHIVTVLRSVNQEAQGITHAEREAESRKAAGILGCDYSQWPEPDNAPDWLAVEAMMRGYDMAYSPERVFAPFQEPHGHEHHNIVGQLAWEVFGRHRLVSYATYRYGGPRTEGTLVPYEREWVLMKLRALACFESQIRLGPVRFFTHSLEEWTRP